MGSIGPISPIYNSPGGLGGITMRKRTSLGLIPGGHLFWIVCLSTLLLIGLSLATVKASAQSVSQYRAFWVDTFNTTLNNHNDIVAVVNNAKAAKANAIVAQVRRRGDSWYLNSIEPQQDFLPIVAGFDALQEFVVIVDDIGCRVYVLVIV